MCRESTIGVSFSREKADSAAVAPSHTPEAKQFQARKTLRVYVHLKPHPFCSLPRAEDSTARKQRWDGVKWFPCMSGHSNDQAAIPRLREGR